LALINLEIKKILDSSIGKMELDINCHIPKGEFVTIFGSSGAGKTSVLRMIAGLMKPDAGKIEVNEKILFDSNNGINTKVNQRSVGYVFQDYALFPNMTLKENLYYAARNEEEKRNADKLLRVVELEELSDRKPDNLSGGQKQRVAIARALVQNPEILLLDEPLSALDPEMRKKLQDFILKIHQSYQITTILVSHDLGEIFRLSQRVIFIDFGKIIKEGTPQEIFTDKKVSGKFKFNGSIVSIERNDVVYIVGVLIGNNLIKVVATRDEVDELNVGDKVVVVSKAFNPLIIKLK